MKRGIRKQAIDKLINGLKEARKTAVNYGASIPKSWKYTTGKTDYYIYYLEEVKTCYITAVFYDGERAYKTIFLNNNL